VAGGIRITEVGVELALACALYSGRTGLALPAGLVIAGELSLTGEIHPVRRLSGRVKTAGNLGFTGFLGPAPESAAVRGTAPEETSALKPLIARDIKSAVKLVYG
jgi:DNA repair protein RadA/Sms